MNTANLKIKHALFATVYIVLASLIMSSIAKVSWAADATFHNKNSQKHLLFTGAYFDQIDITVSSKNLNMSKK